MFVFGPVGDAKTDISLPVRLYRKVCVVTVKRWKAFKHVMLYMNIHSFFRSFILSFFHAIRSVSYESPLAPSKASSPRSKN